MMRNIQKYFMCFVFFKNEIEVCTIFLFPTKDVQRWMVKGWRGSEAVTVPGFFCLSVPGSTSFLQGT